MGKKAESALPSPRSRPADDNLMNMIPDSTLKPSDLSFHKTMKTLEAMSKGDFRALADPSFMESMAHLEGSPLMETIKLNVMAKDEDDASLFDLLDMAGNEAMHSSLGKSGFASTRLTKGATQTFNMSLKEPPGYYEDEGEDGEGVPMPFEGTEGLEDDDGLPFSGTQRFLDLLETANNTSFLGDDEEGSR
jgi:hypothetical protein